MADREPLEYIRNPKFRVLDSTQTEEED